MDDEVIDFDIGLGAGVRWGGQKRLLEENDDDTGQATDDRETGMMMDIPNHGRDMDLEPYEGMEFESEEAAKAFYNSYARRIGFSTRVSSSRRSRRDEAIIQRSFVCAKEGFRNLNEKRTKDREIKRPRSVTRVGCKASLSVKIKPSGKWVVSGFLEDHNHELAAQDEVHRLRSHRQISGPAKTLIDTLQAAGLGPRRIMSALIKEYCGIGRVGFTEVDCRNYMRNSRNRAMEGDFHLVLDYLRRTRSENSTFYAVEGYEDRCTGNVFWADPKARSDYIYFGDAVAFDMTYRSNRYKLPFAPFTGVNHHGQPLLFGCAFLSNESESSFTWLFKTWLSSMSGRPPLSITTDHDPTIRTAVARVLPHTRHRFCASNVLKKTRENLSHVLSSHPNFESDLTKCVTSPDSGDEFERRWSSLVDRYALRDHDWLRSMYATRAQWAMAYVRDGFFAGMSAASSYFDGYVNASTTLSHFFRLYEKAVESRKEKEVRADYDTVHTPPVLRTPSPMEKQVSAMYTRKLFVRFQEELVATLTLTASAVAENGGIESYAVAEYGGDPRAAFTVAFDLPNMKAACSCRTFEFSGLVCRHVLAVFRVTNVLTLPPRYVLRRWTRNARSGVTLDDRTAVNAAAAADHLRSFRTVRYNALRHVAMKLVDRGAVSAGSYALAMDALRQASEAVASALAGEVPGGDRDRRTSSRRHPTQAEMDEKIEELTSELERSRLRCEAYRSHLLSLLSDIDNHKQQFLINVENVRHGLRCMCN